MTEHKIYNIQDSGREVTMENLKAAAQMIYGDKYAEAENAGTQLLDIFEQFKEPTQENMLAVLDKNYRDGTMIRIRKWCPERKASFRFDVRIFSPWVFFNFGNDDVAPGCVAVVMHYDAEKYVEVFGPTTQLETIPFPWRLLPWTVVPILNVVGKV